MLFSVATPTRNSLRYLRRCVGSVRGQSPARVRHIVQDASSTDGTPQWLTLQRDLDARSEPDGGMYDAIGRCWRRAGGEVLSWLNADEQYLPGTIEHVAAAFAADPSIDIVWGNAIVVDATGAAIAARREIPFRRRYVANGFLYLMSCTIFFRRRLLDRGWLAFDPAYRYAADMELMLRLAAMGARLCHLPRYLSLFGLDGANLSLRPEIAAEVADIRERYDGFRSALVRRLILVGRHTERLVRGSYARQDLRYRFALDETPRYRECIAGNVGGRYGRHSLRGHP